MNDDKSNIYKEFPSHKVKKQMAEIVEKYKESENYTDKNVGAEEQEDFLTNLAKDFYGEKSFLTNLATKFYEDIKSHKTFYMCYSNHYGPKLPYNIFYDSISSGAIQLSIAGYDLKDIRIYMQGHELVITTNYNESSSLKEENQDFIYGYDNSSKKTNFYPHKGISTKPFKFIFLIPNNHVFDKAYVDNGILTVHFDLNENDVKGYEISFEVI